MAGKTHYSSTPTLQHSLWGVGPTGRRPSAEQSGAEFGGDMDVIETIEKEQMRLDIPDFKAGDTIRVHARIKEGEKERIQIFQGVVLRKRKGRTGATFTVRKVSYGIGVERIFPLHSPNIDKVEIVSRGKVRRGRLYYLRKLRGKAARIKEKRT
jgi:large subunit ribosomal protein L19